MRIMVTGGNGQLGKVVMDRFSKIGDLVLGFDLPGFDVVDSQKLSGVLEQFEPDVVVHCAAYTDVNGSQREPVSAMAVNWLGTTNVAVACTRFKARMVYISTSFVFDGVKPDPYFEWDKPNPIGVYGLSKLKGEEAVRAHCPDHVILRTNWLYGTEGRGFPERIVETARKMPVTVVNDQWGDPTSADALANAICRVVADGVSGTFHASCTGGGCTKHELAVAALKAAGIEQEVISCMTDSYDRIKPAGMVAERPKNSRMDNVMLRLAIGWAMPDWREELERRFRHISP